MKVWIRKDDDMISIERAADRTFGVTTQCDSEFLTDITEEDFAHQRQIVNAFSEVQSERQKMWNAAKRKGIKTT